VLAKRIIPTLLYKDGLLVKGTGFSADRVCGNALQAARIHAMRSVDELVMLDVGDGEPDYEMIRKLTDRCFTPVTVGGGIKSVEDVQKLLNAGADKVCIESFACASLIKDLAKKFGNQAICASIDVMPYGRPCKKMEKGFLDCDWSARAFAEAVEWIGAGEILLQSVERDGTMMGYDLELIKAVSEAVNIPVVASGGCSGYQDMCDAIRAGASAVAVGALFQFTEATPRRAAEYMHDNGIEVRL